MAEACPFNQVSGRGAWGIVTSGVSRSYVADAIQELGLTDQVRFLELGFTHPLPEDLIGDFLAGLGTRSWWWRNWSRIWRRRSGPSPRTGA